jgi:hypothetical protein
VNAGFRVQQDRVQIKYASTGHLANRSCCACGSIVQCSNAEILTDIKMIFTVGQNFSDSGRGVASVAMTS